MHVGLGNQTLKIAVNDFVPFMSFDNSTGVVKLKTGIEVELILTLAKLMNFSFQILPTPDGHWGNMRPDGSWTGMVGMVHRKEANLSITFTGITEGRSKAVDFSIPYLFPSMKILTKAGKSTSSKNIIFLRAYTPKIWMFIGLTIILAMIVLFVLCKLQKVESGNYKPIWFVYSSMLLHGSEKDIPSNGSTRIFVTSLWLFAFLIMNIFSGQLISATTVAGRDHLIDTLDDLVKGVKNGDYTLTMFRSTSACELLLKSTTGNLLYLGDMLRKNENWLTDSDVRSLQEVGAGGCAYIGEDILDAQGLANNISVHLSKETLIVLSMGIVIPKDCKYKELLNHWISTIFESGLFHKWKASTYNTLFGSRHLEEDAQRGPSPQEVNFLDMSDFQYVFYLAIFGYSVAGIIVLLEKLAYKCAIRTNTYARS